MLFVTKNNTVNNDARIQSGDESMESAEESDQINEVEAHEDQTNAEESNDILNVIHKSIDRIEKK